MSVTVPVIPTPANFLDNESEFYRFLLCCQENLIDDSSQIISYSQLTDPVDPLTVLAAVIPENQVHFYWENCHNQEAMVSYGITKSLELNGSDRFIQSQQFIQNCFQQMLPVGVISKLDFSPKILCGFTFFDNHPPDSSFPAAFVFLPQVQLLKKQNQFFLILNFIVDQNTNLKNLIEQTYQQVKLIKKSQEKLFNHAKNITPFSQSFQINRLSPLENSVTKILNSIQANHFSKLVIAQALDIVAPSNFKIINCLQNLRQNYADCYIFSLSNGRNDCFLGASPERLISIQNQQLVTDALAGSAPRGKTKIEDITNANHLLQSEKERREHQAVIEFIVQSLQELGLNPQRSPLKLLKLSNIQHLWTPIYAQLKPAIHPLEIIAKLHPTPAVAGVPTQVACAAIQEYETFDRSLYASPLGWVDYQGNSEFIVGIRSALIHQNKARLYAGAGIVAGSDPIKELAEIELKLQALLQALSY
jgi:menaquinone-specific isochorismate synthase